MKIRKSQKKTEYLPQVKEKKSPDRLYSRDDGWLDYYGGGEYYGSPPTRGREYDPCSN